MGHGPCCSILFDPRELTTGHSTPARFTTGQYALSQRTTQSWSVRFHKRAWRADGTGLLFAGRPGGGRLLSFPSFFVTVVAVEQGREVALGIAFDDEAG